MKSRTLRLVATGLLVALLLGGCAPILWSLRASSELEWNGNDRVELPLILDKVGHVGVPANVQGVEVLAMLDTGAGLPMLSPATASAIGMQEKSSGKKTRVATNVSVQLGPASLTLPLAPVSDGIGNAQLILGAELFSQAVVDIDYEARLVTLINPKAFSNPNEEPLPIDLHYGRPTADIQINGRKPAICALVDTGSPFGASFSAKLVQKLSLPGVPNQTSGYRRVDGKLRETPALAPLAEVKIGNRILKNVPALGLTPNDKPPCGSILGMAALSRFHLIFHIGNRKIWLLQR